MADQVPNNNNNVGMGWAAVSWFLHRLPRFRGKKRAARFFLENVFRMQNQCIKDRCGIVFYVPSMREPLAQHIFIDGIYEPETCEVVERILKRGNLFFDVGANIGFFSLRAARMTGEEGGVCAFEASPRIAEVLRENVRLNSCTNVQVINAAVSKIKEEKLLFYESPQEKFGMGALSPQFEVEPICVESITLDAFVEKKEGVKKVDLIKVDVEGHEASVFRGAAGLLKKQSPVIVFEFCDWAEKRAGFELGESQRVLLEYGYDLWLINDYLRGKPPLSEIITEGFLMIVAQKKRS